MAGPTAESNPDAFAGKVTLSAYEPYPSLIGTAWSSFSGVAVIPWVQPGPVGFNKVVVLASLNAGVPGATGQASTGTNAHSFQYNAAIYKRQDYAANSSNLSCVVTGSFGLTANLVYSSTSQSFGMSWVTDSTGGLGTFGTTSSDAAWSNYASGPKFINIPMSANLTAGEYCIMFQGGSTSGTTGSNVTLISCSQLQIQAVEQSAGVLGGSVTLHSYPPGMPMGVIGSGNSTTSTTMAASVVSFSTRQIYFNLRQV